MQEQEESHDRPIASSVASNYQKLNTLTLVTLLLLSSKDPINSDLFVLLLLFLF